MRHFFLDAETAEVGLLLPGREAAALERVAHRWGLTVGQLLRLLVRDFLACEGLLPGSVAAQGDLARGGPLAPSLPPAAGIE
jgi:hypothetical protein